MRPIRAPLRGCAISACVVRAVAVRAHLLHRLTQKLGVAATSIPQARTFINGSYQVSNASVTYWLVSPIAVQARVRRRPSNQNPKTTAIHLMLPIVLRPVAV